MSLNVTCLFWVDFGSTSSGGSLPLTTTSSTMSDYDIRPGGSLKLKGGVTEGGIVKKCVIAIVCESTN